nr:helix-turn-helix domain-containing protein [Burkholderia ubonensis]
MRELNRFKVIQDVADGKLKPWRAAERLGLTTRQIRRLVGRLQEHGPQGLVSQRRARSPATIDWPGIATRLPTSQRSPAHQLFTRFVTLTVPMPVAKFQPTPAPKAFR